MVVCSAIPLSPLSALPNKKAAAAQQVLIVLLNNMAFTHLLLFNIHYIACESNLRDGGSTHHEYAMAQN
jgi:hypothetical protein